MHCFKHKDKSVHLLTTHKSQDPAIAICNVLENGKKQNFRPTYRNISKERELKTIYRQTGKQKYLLSI